MSLRVGSLVGTVFAVDAVGKVVATGVVCASWERVADGVVRTVCVVGVVENDMYSRLSVRSPLEVIDGLSREGVAEGEGEGVAEGVAVGVPSV